MIKSATAAVAVIFVLYIANLWNATAAEKVITTDGEAIKYINALKADGSEKSFQDIVGEFKGKVIYVDFWASWCGPCRAQFPHSQEVHKQFDSKNVAFVYISFDEEEKDWKKTVDKYKLAGYHLFPTMKQKREIYDRFKVDGIPRYLLLDKNGKVVDDDAPRPSSGIAAEITKLLK